MKNMKAMALEEMMGSEKPLAMGKAPEVMPVKEMEGMESILVTPEEKAMIMAMRGESDLGDDMEGDDDEAPGQVMGV